MALGKPCYNEINRRFNMIPYLDTYKMSFIILHLPNYQDEKSSDLWRNNAPFSASRIFTILSDH